MLDWIENHFKKLHQLQLNTHITDLDGSILKLEEGFKRYVESIRKMNAKSKIIIIGNGGSAGIASHLAIDYSKNGGIPAMTFSDASALTCLSNDYGYEHVFSKQIEFHMHRNDILVAISSSGKSVNILNAVYAAKKLGNLVMTFSGFDIGNPLNKLGDVNFYIDSNEYGFVEVAHLALGHTLLDYIIEEKINRLKEKSKELLEVAV